MLLSAVCFFLPCGVLLTHLLGSPSFLGRLFILLSDDPLLSFVDNSGFTRG